MNGKFRLAVVVAFCALLTPGGSALATTLSGRVYEGGVGDESKPLAGVTITLYGSNNASQQGTEVISSTTTNSSGWYEVSARGAYDYFNIVQTNLSGYTSEGATTVGGSVKSSDWIQYGYEDIFVTPATMTGNKFWDKKEGQPPENRPPVAQDDSASTSEDTPVTINVLANDSDPDGDPLGIQSVTDPPHGTAVIDGQAVRYTPDNGYAGSDSFSYTISDGRGGTSTANVAVGVSETPVENRPPVANDDSAFTSQDTAVTINVLANDSDPDGDPLSIQSVTDPPHGTAVRDGQTVRYTPDSGFTGSDTFSYTISDGRGGTDSANVTVRVAEAPVENRPPVAQDDSATTSQDTAVTINVLANDSDPDGDPLSIQSMTAPTHGIVDWSNANAQNVQYTPDSGFTGSDTFSYTISDGRGGTDTATVTVTVVGDEEPPADKGTIRGVKFNDLNGNGVRDPGEPPLSGWRIELWLYENGDFCDWTHIATTTTDASGAYAFEPSSSGQYQVREESQSGWTQTYPSGHHTVSFNTSQTIEDLDFGNHREGGFDFGDAPAPYPDASHTPGQVWLGFSVPDTETGTQASPLGQGDDTNGFDDEDGVSFLGAIVPGQFAWIGVAFSGTTQYLTCAIWIDYNRNGTWEHPAELYATSNVGGLSTLPLGVYIANPIPSSAQIGTTYMRCRVYPGLNATVSPTGSAQGGEVEDYPVEITRTTGPIQPPRNVITGIKFNDLDGDGIWEPADGETKLSNWTIWLDTNSDGTPDQTTITDSQGGFEFSGLSAGTYTVGEEQQLGWTQTTPPAPGTYSVMIPGGDQPTIHFVMFGNQRAGQAGDKDYGDAPLPYPEASHQTGGPYLGLFGDAPDAEPGMQRDAQAAGDDNDANGDDENGLLSVNLVKTPGAWSTWAYKGYFNSSADAKCGFWIDFNGDGDWDDPNELWIQFGFCGFGTGPQDWFHVTGAFQLPADAKVGMTYVRLRVYGDCNATPSPSGAGGPGEVEDYQVEIKADGPGVPPGGIVHGYKWNDINGSGLWDILNPVEPPLAGWTIWLDTNGSGKQDAGDMTTQTDAQGHFRFTGVPAGTYTLGEQLQPGWTQTTPGGAGTYAVTVQPGQGTFPQMFGNRQSGGPTSDGQICGSKWNDLNGNAIWDLGEPYLSGWTVYLDMNHNGRLDPGEPAQLTDASGAFLLTGLAAGSYAVAEQMQAGWQQTWPGPAATHTISIQPGGVQPACVMFGNQQGDGPSPALRFDWGDAPDPTYPTLRVSNGAYHVIAPGFHLGQSIDGEPDGQSTPDALGDDYFDADDEDGVIFLTPILPGGMADLEVSASAPGYIDAWIDFDGDGSWSQPSDQIMTAEPVVAGSNVLSVAVPALAQSNIATFARLRLSRVGRLPPEGPGQAGEVEDYHVLLGEQGPYVPGEAERSHVKWSQPPLEIDPNVDAPPVLCGWNQPSTSTVLADGRRVWNMAVDDFHCLGSIPVTHLRWWGFYKGWEKPELPPIQPQRWQATFWINRPETADENPFPEKMVWRLDVPVERVQIEPVGLDAFPQPFSEMCFRYDLALEPSEWFRQAEFPSEQNMYWIGIAAVYDEGAGNSNLWGWATRPEIWRNPGQIIVLYGDGTDADTQLWPGMLLPVATHQLCGQERGYDMAFELLTEPPWVKWDRPFTGIRDWPHYEDVESQGISTLQQENIGRVVADDWFCESSTPVVAAAWRGSYIGHGHEACKCDAQREPPRPDYFLLSIWTDAPTSRTGPGSPGDVVWEYRTFDYDEVLVGCDRHPEGEPNEPVFRYAVRLPEENWFRPESPGRIYWLSITAVYADPLPMIAHPWGWTSHVHAFESGASFIDYRAATPPEWRPLVGPEDQPIDMSFTLFTVPEPPFPEEAVEAAE